MFSTLALTVLLLQPPADQLPPLQTPDPPPYAGEWMVDVIDNIKVMPGSEITIRIEASALTGSGSIRGIASCNTYRGGFTMDGEMVKVGALLKTMKACDPARMSEETDFLAILGEVVSFERQADDVLVLTTAKGKTITAVRR